ncbi:MAG: ABC transporter permease subunit, partial [Promethearchaeota archaeon]
MNIKKIYKDIIFSFLIAIVTLFIGLIISFVLVKVMPIRPGPVLLLMNYTSEHYNELPQQLGEDYPLIIQFFRYIGKFFTGDWGVSNSLEPGREVLDLIKESFPIMIEVLIFPVLVGLAVGILLGKIAIKHKNRWPDKVIRVHAILGISVPVFWLGILFQYIFSYQLGWLPTYGFKSGEWKYYIMPLSILTIAISSLIILQTRSTLESEPTERSLISNTLIIGKSFGFVIMIYILTEITFKMHGIGEMLINVLHEYDILMLSGLLFVLILILIIITFIANIIFSLYRNFLSKPKNEQPEFYNKVNNEREDIKIKLKKNVKKLMVQSESPELEKLEIPEERRFRNSLFTYFKFLIIPGYRLEDLSIREFEYEKTISKRKFIGRLKTPLIMIGIVLTFVVVSFAVFCPWISAYTLAETVDFYPNSEYPDQLPYMSPSKDHPLGTTKFGRDLLAVISWAVRDTLNVGIGASFIGLMGGSIFGFIAGRFNKKVYNVIMGLMIIVFVIPVLIIALIIIFIYGTRYIYLINISTIGITLIPSFTQVIANAVLKKCTLKRIIKVAISYFPLNVAIAILIYISFGFLEVIDPFGLPVLSFYIAELHSWISDAPHAAFWPGLAIFMILI